MKMGDSLIFGDGETVTIVMSDFNSNQEIAYTVKEPIINEVKIQRENNFGLENFKPNPLTRIDVGMVSRQASVELAPQGGLIKKYSKTLQKASVKELFAEIYKKLEQREEKNDG